MEIVGYIGATERKQEMLTSPLHHLHKNLTNDFGVYAPWGVSLPDSFQSPSEDYVSWTSGGGIFDTSFDGILRLHGKDCLSLLHRLSTNEVATLPEERSIFTVLTTEKGRVVDSIQILNCRSGLLAICSPGRQHDVASWIDRYTIREDVRVEKINTMASLTLSEPVSKALTLERTIPSHGEISETANSVVISMSDLGIRLLGPIEEIARLHGELVTGGNMNPVGFAAINYWRTEKRIPWWGTELNDSTNPLEADLVDRISFKKGCYVGQEVIARLDTYSKIQRHLVLLELEEPVTLPAVVSLEGQEIGRITSCPSNINSSINICLAYIKTSLCQFDGKLSILSTNSQQMTTAIIRNS